MSLRSFHLFFILASVTLAGFVAAWATGEYRTAHAASYAVTSASAIVAALALAFYANAFRRKTRNL
jgi:hypothetical protein